MRSSKTVLLLATLLVLTSVEYTKAQAQSRYRFVPQQKNESPRPAEIANPDANTHRSTESRIPTLDESTSPLRLAPTVDRTVFLADGDFVPNDRNPDAAEPYYVASLVAPPLQVSQAPVITGDYGLPNGTTIVDSGFSENLIHSPAQIVESNCLSGNCGVSSFPRTNFFGVDLDSCCDEWDGFCGCGGLKANPGHFGKPHCIGKDPCEQAAGCGCRGKHSCKAKQKNSSDCTTCESKPTTKIGLFNHFGFKKSGCECSECSE